MEREENTLQELQDCNNSHHGRRTTFFCVVSPFGLISPGTAWFINKHKTISRLNYQQESPRRWRGRVSIRGCPQFITPLPVWSLSRSHLISMLWATPSIWNGIWSWSMSRVTLKTTNGMRGCCHFFMSFFSKSYPRRHTNSAHMAHERKPIFLINYQFVEINQKDAACTRQCQMKTWEDKAREGPNCCLHVIYEKTSQVAM